MADEALQTAVIRLSPPLLRRVMEYVDAGEAYASISEFAGIALANQLELELGGTPVNDRAAGPGRALLARPEHEPVDFAQDCDIDAEPLFVLTNRLFPLKLSCRILANLQAEGSVPVGVLQEAAARAARNLGLALRAEDEEAGRRGAGRRWVALPVGADEHAAIDRFAHFFTLGLSGAGRPTGPLAHLGLAYPDADASSCRLTELGWDLAEAENPVLDAGADVPLLGDRERDLFVEALRTNDAEISAVSEFCDTVQSCAGGQAEVDAALQRLNPSWNRERATAHRAAMVGRLRDLGLAEVDGRGPSARIRLNASVTKVTQGRADG